MSRNYVEDLMIDRIDFQRSGLDQVVLDEQAAYGTRLSNLCGWVVTSMSASADQFPQETDRSLALKIGSVEMLLGRELDKLDFLLQNSGVSKRQLKFLMKALSPEDPVRVQLSTSDQRIRGLERKRDEIIQCLYARKFLKTRRDWIGEYLRIKGYRKPGLLDFMMQRLTELYPEC